MDCDKAIIKVEPLSKEEAWKLFQEKLGKQLPANTNEIAKSIAMECAGLPLGIITIASSLKGVEVDDINEWRNTLWELKESITVQSDMKEDVFPILKFSYDRLGDSALQKCFLCCGLYPEDHKIRRVRLIDYMIDEGVIQGRSRKAEFDKGHAMLNKLERVCLLEGGVDDAGYKYVKMHDLIRDVAIQLMKADTLVCTESKVLDCESCTTDLVRISVTDFKAVETAFNYSPMCPKLSSLLFFGYYPSFRFEWQPSWVKNSRDSAPHSSSVPIPSQLKILYIHNVQVGALHDSVFKLFNLTTLSLRGCNSVYNLPSLANLKALKKLDLSFTKVREVPRGVEFLFNLKYLGLFKTSVKEFSPGLLPKLSCLQVLILDPFLAVEVEELTCLRKLETLCCRLCGYQFLVDDNVTSSDYMGIGSLQLNEYFVWMGKESNTIYYHWRSPMIVHSPTITLLPRKDSGSSLKWSERKMLNLQSYHTEGWLRFENESMLKMLVIEWLVGIKSLFKLGSASAIETLQHIEIRDSKDLKKLFSPSATLSNGTFSLLETFEIQGCPSMKKLFPPCLLSNLQNLKLLSVWDCKNMEELIAAEEQESNHSSSLALPKLLNFELDSLPELKSICSRNLICTSLEEICIWSCPKLKQIPSGLLFLENDQTTPLPSLQCIDVDPREWWEMVELDHPNAKNTLSPLVSHS